MAGERGPWDRLGGWRVGARGFPSKPVSDSEVVRRGWGGADGSPPIGQTGAGFRLHSATWASRHLSPLKHGFFCSMGNFSSCLLGCSGQRRESCWLRSQKCGLLRGCIVMFCTKD